MKTCPIVMAALAFAAAFLLSPRAEAGNCSPPDKDCAALQKSEQDGTKLKALPFSDDGSGISFLKRPGSGLILGGASITVWSVYSVMVPILLLPGGDNITSGWVAAMASLALIPSGIMVVAGVVMIGVGLSQNLEFSSGHEMYRSPKPDYILLGILDVIAGGFLVFIGSASLSLSYSDLDAGISAGYLGFGIFTAVCGIAFFAYGAAADFTPPAKVRKAGGTIYLSPYLACSGGACDGKTGGRLTGRETWFGGIRGNF